MRIRLATKEESGAVAEIYDACCVELPARLRRDHDSDAGSIGLHEALGFRHIGTFHEAGFKLGVWHDVGWWSLQLNTRERAPANPVPLGDPGRFME